jgi:hypothetical protein
LKSAIYEGYFNDWSIDLKWLQDLKAEKSVLVFELLTIDGKLAMNQSTGNVTRIDANRCFNRKLIDKSVIELICKKYQTISEFQLIDCLQVDDEFVSCLIDSTPVIRLLDLSGTKISNQTLKLISQKCSQSIEHLMIERIEEGQITIDQVIDCVSKCQKLIELGIDQRLLTNEMIEKLIELRPTLKISSHPIK